MQKEKVLIYPFDIEFCPVVRHKNLLLDYEIVNLVSPIGWGFDNKDIAFVDGGDETGMLINGDYSKSLDQCDTVIFSYSRYHLNMEEDIYTKMKEAILKSKNIISVISLNDKYQRELEELRKENNSYIRLLNEKNDYDRYNVKKILGIDYENREDSYIFETISNIDTPVVFVMGVTERTCKFEIQLALREKLQNLGYKISQVGSKNYCELLGFNSFPDFMYCNSISEVEKIVMFNNYIKEIDVNEEPDIIIIGIPGGTMKVNNEYTNKFGIFAYEISQAVDPDYVIMSTFYEDFKQEYFEKTNISTKYKFGYNIDCFNMANTKLDWAEAMKLSNDIYLKLDGDFVSKKIEHFDESSIKIHNVLNKKHSDSMVLDLINKLNEYTIFEVI